MTRKWTKKDTRTLMSQVDSFVLENRMYYPPERICAALSTKRAEIVVGNLRGFRGLLAERERKNAEAVKHFEDHPSIYGSSTPEMVERFRKFADEEGKAVRKADELIARVEAEGLPDEVVQYTPDMCKS